MRNETELRAQICTPSWPVWVQLHLCSSPFLTWESVANLLPLLNLGTLRLGYRLQMKFPPTLSAETNSSMRFTHTPSRLGSGAGRPHRLGFLVHIWHTGWGACSPNTGYTEGGTIKSLCVPAAASGVAVFNNRLKESDN